VAGNRSEEEEESPTHRENHHLQTVARATVEKPSLAQDRNMKYPNMEVIKDILLF
jgi:hypothetical protein